MQKQYLTSNYASTTTANVNVINFTTSAAHRFGSWRTQHTVNIQNYISLIALTYTVHQLHNTGRGFDNFQNARQQTLCNIVKMQIRCKNRRFTDRPNKNITWSQWNHRRRLYSDLTLRWCLYFHCTACDSRCLQSQLLRSWRFDFRVRCDRTLILRTRWS